MSKGIPSSWSEADLIGALTDPENSFVERKSFSDKRGWTKTVVAFSNSCEIGQSGVLLIGGADKGGFQETEEERNLDTFQGTVSDVLDSIYPRVHPQYKPLRFRGQTCLAVVVPGSSKRPHFAGPAYIRDGSRTIEASEGKFAELIAQHSSKVREILQWKGKQITAHHMRITRPDILGPVVGFFEPTVEACDSQKVTFSPADSRQSYPLERVRVSYDHERGRLLLEISPV